MIAINLINNAKFDNLIPKNSYLFLVYSKDFNDFLYKARNINIQGVKREYHIVYTYSGRFTVPKRETYSHNFSVDFLIEEGKDDLKKFYTYITDLQFLNRKTDFYVISFDGSGLFTDTMYLFKNCFLLNSGDVKYDYDEKGHIICSLDFSYDHYIVDNFPDIVKSISSLIKI